MVADIEPAAAAVGEDDRIFLILLCRFTQLTMSVIQEIRKALDVVYSIVTKT